MTGTARLVYRGAMQNFEHASTGLFSVRALCCLATAMVVGLMAGCASGPRTPIANESRDAAPVLPPPPAVWEDKPVEPQVEPIRPGGPNKPYEVQGERYEPLVEDEPWRETGLASWYGAKFHGRRTASGELYSMYGMTAAHKTLPIPSYVRVRSKRNGQELILRVNDRGPFVKGRVIDVSYAAAVRLGLVTAGVGEVEIERITFEDIRTGAWRSKETSAQAQPQIQSQPVPMASALSPVRLSTPDTSPAVGVMAASPQAAAASDPPTAPAQGADPIATRATALATSRAGTPAGRGFWVQLAALSRREGVEKMQQRVSRELASLMPMLAVFKEQSLYKLKIGPFASRTEAQDAVVRARAALQVEPMLVQRR